MKNDTINATITQQEIEQLEQAYNEYTEAQYELDRFIGTVESYGSWTNVKPDYSFNQKGE